jgi:acyl-CoA thioesterase YciA
MSQDWNLIVSVFALPKDTNSQQTVFGGWLLSHQDLACLSQCKLHEPGKYLTVGIKDLVFVSTVDIGDLVRVYTQVKHVGTTSIQIVQKTTKNNLQGSQTEELVSTGVYTFVKVDSNNTKQEITRKLDPT